MRMTEIQSAGLSALWFVSGAFINPLVFFDFATAFLRNEVPNARKYELSDGDFDRLRSLLKGEPE